MALLRGLIKYWIFIIAAAAGAYLLVYNRDFIYVNIPRVAQFKVMTAVAFIACFVAGATSVVVYFFFETIKKSFEIRTLTKRVRSLENQLGKNSGQSLPAVGVEPDRAGGTMSTQKSGDAFPPEGEIF